MFVAAFRRVQGNRLFYQIAVINIIFIFVLMVLYGISLEDVPKERYFAPHFVPTDNCKAKSFECKETFNHTLEDNLKVIQNYPRGIADNYLWKIGANMSKPFRMKEFPVFVTAFDKRYYPQSQGLFRDLHLKFLNNPKYHKNVHIIVYDLGMTKRQITMLQKKCKCEIRRFPYEEFPEHVKTLHTYAFKPIIVQQMLMEFGYVWWMDSSVRFTTDDLDPVLEYTEQNSMFFTVTTSDKDEFSLTKQTDTRTFEFLHEDRCKFQWYGETWATTVMFHYDQLSRAVVEAWAVCALNIDCIAPPGSLDKLICRVENKSDGRCHRFDQSALGIFTRRLFHEQNTYPYFLPFEDIYLIKRGDFVSYFETCVPLVKCML